MVVLMLMMMMMVLVGMRIHLMVGRIADARMVALLRPVLGCAPEIGALVVVLTGVGGAGHVLLLRHRGGLGGRQLRVLLLLQLNR